MILFRHRSPGSREIAGPGGERAATGILRLAGTLLLAVASASAAQDRFIDKIALPTGQTLVIAEGDFEARSVGSFSLRLYAAAPAADATTFFLTGMIQPRDGVVERVTLADIDGDAREDVVVIMRSVGTGNYLAAHAVAIADDRLIDLLSIDGLTAGADPVAALRESWELSD
jgi:hypothetical protein